MKVLLLAEHTNSALSAATGKALTAAAALGGTIDVLVAGHNARAAADGAAKLTGVAKVMLAEGPQFEHGLAEEVAALIIPLMANYDALVAPATTMGKNILPRVAAALDVMQVSDITKVVSTDTFERPIYAGNAIQTVQSAEPKKVLTVRISAFASADEGGSAQVETISAPAAGWPVELRKGRAHDL